MGGHLWGDRTLAAGAGERAGARRAPGRSRAATLVALAVVVLSVELGARILSPWFHDEFEGWGSGDVAAKAAHIEYVSEHGGADVVVTGTSQVYWGINGQIVANVMGRPGATVYNAGLLGGTPLIQRQWMRNTVVPALEPEIVVWGVSPLDFAVDNPILGGTAQNFLESRNGAPGLGASLDRWLAEHLAVVRHRQQLRSPQRVIEALTRMRNNDPPPQLDGESIESLGPSGTSRPLVRHIDWSVDEVDRTLRLLASGFENSSTQREAMIETIDALEADGIRVVLVVMPVSRLCMDLQFGPGRTLRPFYEAVAAVADATGAPVLDLHGSGTPDGLFADAVHLNGDGATTFSRLLGLLLRDPAAEVDALKEMLIEAQGLDVTTGLAPGIPAPIPREPDVIDVLEGLGWQRAQPDGPLVPPPAVVADDLPELVVPPTPLLPPTDDPQPKVPRDLVPTEPPTKSEVPVPVDEPTGTDPGLLDPGDSLVEVEP